MAKQYVAHDEVVAERGAGRMRVEQTLLAESWNPDYAALGFDPESADPPFLQPAVSELAKADVS